MKKEKKKKNPRATDRKHNQASALGDVWPRNEKPHTTKKTPDSVGKKVANALEVNQGRPEEKNGHFIRLGKPGCAREEGSKTIEYWSRRGEKRSTVLRKRRGEKGLHGIHVHHERDKLQRQKKKGVLDRSGVPGKV